MPPELIRSSILKGQKALIVGVANDRSIAWGCAQAMHRAGADIAMTYLNDRARPYVEPLAQAVDAPLLMPLEVRDTPQLDALFEAIAAKWGRLDILVHSIAFAPREALAGRVTDCPRDGFLTAMDVSCWSFLDLTRRAEKLMTGGGTIFAMSYHGADRVIENYGIMGRIGSALPGRRARAQRNSRARYQPGPARHPGRLGDSGFRHTDGAGGGASPGPPSGVDRGGRRRLRVPREPLRRCDDRRYDLY
jgi:enoyl-[acyl-carrier-protein] reductase (NADH)